MIANNRFSGGRIASIDIFRAITMVLMIFVNDLWTLHDIPKWLGHTDAKFDGMGLADVVFPAFLFIVGLSIPHAIEARRKKGDKFLQLVSHIVIRSLALIIMGFFLVNYENINRELLQVSKPVFGILLIIAFFLIWNLYSVEKLFGKIPVVWFKIAGILLLVFLTYIYKGGTVENAQWLKTYWWGILGIIGWAYFLSATVYVVSGGRIIWIVVAWLIFLALNLQEFLPVFGESQPLKIIVSASNYSLVTSGVLATVIFQKIKKLTHWEWKYFAILVGFAALLLIYGFAVRPIGGISKIMATPSWTMICAGISFGIFAMLFLVSDLFKLTGWAKIISPAGRSTLTCYLIPYLVYPVLTLMKWDLPDYFTYGIVGIMKSILFALMIVGITALFEKIHIKLKI